MHLFIHFVWREKWVSGPLDGGKWFGWMVRGLEGIRLEDQGEMIYGRGLWRYMESYRSMYKGCTKGEDLFHMLMLTRQLH